MVTIGAGAEAVHFSLVDLDNGDGMVYDAYFKIVGDERRANLQELIGTDDFQEMTPGPGGTRHMAMRKVLHQSQRAALYGFLEEELLPLYAKDPESFNSIAVQVGVDPEAFHEKIVNMIAVRDEVGDLPDPLEEQLTHVRQGAGRREQALPLPTQKLKQDPQIEPRF